MRLTSLAATAALLLAACSSEPEVREPDPTPSTSPTPTVAAPTMPAQAKEDSSEGAVAFVRHWIDTFNKASVSGDTTALEGLSDGCEPCDSYSDAIRQTFEDGEAPTGDIWELEKAEVLRGEEFSSVKAYIAARDESGPVTYVFGFETTPAPPYKVRDLYEVEQ